MKVNIGNKVYKVSFVTVGCPPKYGKKKDSEVVVKTNCLITNGSATVVGKGFASQNYRDELNWETGRKVSLARALKKFKKKETRSEFWNIYKQEYPIKG